GAGRGDSGGRGGGSSPKELITAGSGSIEQSATAVRQACAHARRALLARAAEELGVHADELSCEGGSVRATDGRHRSYWDLVGTAGFGITIDDVAPALPPTARKFAGPGLRRVDLPGKLRGEPVFVHDSADVRHARVVRPGWIGHQLAQPADADVLVRTVHVALGIAVDVVVDGSFVAVIADREGDAALAADEVATHLQWVEPPAYAGSPADPDHMVASVESSVAVVDGTASEEAAPPPLPHEGAATLPAP